VTLDPFSNIDLSLEKVCIFHTLSQRRLSDPNHQVLNASSVFPSFLLHYSQVVATAYKAVVVVVGSEPFLCPLG